MKKSKSAKADMCYIWAKSFCVEDIADSLCKKTHKSIEKVLDSLGIGLSDFVLAEIFEVDYDGEDFSVSPYSCGYFPGKDIGDIVDYADLLEIEKTYKLIEDYVSENFKDD